jgi:hypothetical protein
VTVSRRLLVAALLAAVASVAAATPATAAAKAQDKTGRPALFIGLDTSGSFHRAAFEDAQTFIAYYIYGHLHGLGGLVKPREMFVAGVGGNEAEDAKSFHPVHDFAGKDIQGIEAELRKWFPPRDQLTDFNTFFRQVARVAAERGLQLSPITVLIVTDGVPDIQGIKPGSPLAYGRIDLSPLEYLSRNVTVRLVYSNPAVGEKWRKLVPRQRVRLWTVDWEIMKGWRQQVKSGADPSGQVMLWKWVRENVDFRVRRGL